MNMFENAQSIKAMLKIDGMTQCKLASVLGVSQSFVANKVRLLSFSDTAKEKILEYGLSERHARCILRLDSDEDRLCAIEKVHLMNMNVERCEILVDTMLDTKKRETVSSVNYSDRMGHFESSLESSLALLRAVGLRARARREESGDMIYFSITIG